MVPIFLCHQPTVLGLVHAVSGTLHRIYGAAALGLLGAIGHDGLHLARLPTIDVGLVPRVFLMISSSKSVSSSAQSSNSNEGSPAST